MTSQEKYNLQKFLTDKAFHKMMADLRKLSERLDESISLAERAAAGVKVITK